MSAELAVQQYLLGQLRPQLPQFHYAGYAGTQVLLIVEAAVNQWRYRPLLHLELQPDRLRAWPIRVNYHELGPRHHSPWELPLLGELPYEDPQLVEQLLRALPEWARQAATLFDWQLADSR